LFYSKGIAAVLQSGTLLVPSDSEEEETMKSTKLIVVSLSGITLFVSLAVRQLQAQVSGIGSTNHVAIWTDSTSLGNSKIVQTGGKVGIGTTSPAATLDLQGPNATTVGAAAQSVLHVLGGSGGPASTSTSGGAGSSLQLSAGAGGSLLVCGSTCRGAGGGGGGSMTLQPGTGAKSNFLAGTGGAVVLQGGAKGTGPGGRGGYIVLQASGGNVGIGETAPANTLEVVTGGTTLADSWNVRSSRRFKINIKPLQDSLERIERLQGVSFERRSGEKREIGVIAEDVARIVPEVVSHDPITGEVEGVDYSRLTALLIEAVKAQQAEIRELRTEVEQFKSGTIPR
jgi:hypothetical protein